MATKNILDIEQSWVSVSKVLFVPYTEAQYDELVRVLNALLDTIGEDETHPLASLMDVVGMLIKQYEDEHIPELTDLGIPSILDESFPNTFDDELRDTQGKTKPFYFPSPNITVENPQYEVNYYSGGTVTFPLKRTG